jgi:hypothetical protein
MRLPQFKSLLRHHWMEEAQHTKLDTLMVQALTDNRSATEMERGFSDYSAIGALIDGGIPQQVKPEQEQFLHDSETAQRWTYLGSAMHLSFQSYMVHQQRWVSDKKLISLT